MKKWIKKLSPYFFAIGILGVSLNYNPTTLEQRTALVLSIIFLFISSIILYLNKPKN